MMSFIPIRVNDVIVLNAEDICENESTSCRLCSELAVTIHNWFVANELRYLIVDFQDEKYVCNTILLEFMQFTKRLKFPLLLVGLTENPKNFLKSYDYRGPLPFDTPEEAVEYLAANHTELISKNLKNINFNEMISPGKTKHHSRDELVPLQEAEVRL